MKNTQQIEKKHTNKILDKMKQCKQCTKEIQGRADKQFCSPSCKKKWRYYNDTLYRKRKIDYVKVYRSLNNLS